MKKDEQPNESEPVIAPGIQESYDLNRPATEEEMEKGETTRVTQLRWDEVDPS